MSDLEHRMERFAVAASVLVEAYGEVTRQGRFAQPGLAAAALADIKSLIRHLANEGLDEVPYGGADVNAQIALERKFHEHMCTCSFCPGRGGGYLREHDWRIDEGGVQRCAACTLAYPRWTGRGCPEDPEALKGSVYW